MSEDMALATARGRVYDLLATVFRRPLDAARLARLRDPAMLAAIAEAGGDLGAEFAARDEAALLDELAIDYTQIFHNPGGDRVSPYESVQLDSGDSLMGPAAKAVRHFMAEVGFEVAPGAGELPDHVSVELAFMAALAQREAATREAGDPEMAATAVDLQRRFLAAHLGRWAESFASQVRARATTRLYAAMADLLAGFLRVEREEAEAA